MEMWLLADTWIALLTLTFLEIVLGIDNIIFISLISNRLPEEQQPRARFIGLVLALLTRIAMLIGILALMALKEPLFSIAEHPVSIRDILLLAGGLFLLAKSTSEIHEKISGKHNDVIVKVKKFGWIIVQIVLFDIIFSLDSVLTAVGMVDEISLMIIAVSISMIIMIIFSKRISLFINNNPTLQILALAFLILIGFMLILESMHYEIPKGYIYFAIFFSLIVELLNMKLRKKKPKEKK
ncbi:MAG: TerC family protein [Crocinitomicaceae bacterium]